MSDFAWLVVYNIVLFALTVAAAYFISPWCFLMLLLAGSKSSLPGEKDED